MSLLFGFRACNLQNICSHTISLRFFSFCVLAFCFSAVESHEHPQKTTRRGDAPASAVEPPVMAAVSSGLPKRPRTATAGRATTSPSRAPDSTDTSNLQALIEQEVQRTMSTAVTNAVQLLLSLPRSASPLAVGKPDPAVNAVTTATQHQHSQQVNLTVPQALLDRIQRGGPVDFDCLLPDTIAASSSAAPVAFQLGSSGCSFCALEYFMNPSPELFVAGCMSTWVEVWTLFMNSLCSAAPHCLHECMSYQAMIAAANHQFLPEAWLSYQAMIAVANRQFLHGAWLSYDCQLRIAMVSQPGKKLDVIDINLGQLCFIGKA